MHKLLLRGYPAYLPAIHGMSIFERCALGLMGALVAGLTVVAVKQPADGMTVAPRAVFDSIATELAALPSDRDDLSDEAVPDPKAAPTHSVETLSSHFDELGYDLDAVVAGERHVPRVTLVSIPSDLKDVREVKTRKEIFFQTVLPLVLQVNEEVAAERERLWKIQTDRALGRNLDAVDRLWLAVMSDKYKVKRGDLDALLRRADVIPPSLALAQAAEESGWGTSRFVREGNAIFGQWTYSKAQGIKPKDIDPGKTHRVRAFDDLIGSVRAYTRNLNTHRAYRGFRERRAELRQDGEVLNGRHLAETLTSYSQRGEDYVRTLERIMSANALHKLDDAKLDAGDSGLRMAGETAEPSETSVPVTGGLESAI